ncbi:hypothetical protein GCM10010082_05900 [Kushneria pakistanensis]|uniref:Integrase n=1 Tax=Kushneria pakistanensis TaxID=1508770 RepID=A0ABQ3FCA7_9GAMM|nr:hypothetical protein GCM10010082_05900 [Kushneria pakistanensis]
MGMAQPQQSRLFIKRRDRSEEVKACPRPGNREHQVTQAMNHSMRDYRHAYEELAKV